MNTIGSTVSCDWCSTSIQKKKDDHRFCGDKCRKKWHRKRNGKPLVPNFVKVAKKTANKAIRRKISDVPNRTNIVPISPTLSPRMAEIQTKINWLESQKTSEISSSGVMYGAAGAAASRLFVKDWRLNLFAGIIGFAYGRSQDENKIITNKLQNANIQRQIDELITEITKEKDRIKNIPPPPSTNHDDYKLISADRVNELEHSKYELDGKWRYFLNYMPTSFNGIIYGLPKAGKTHLSIQFAQYLQNKFGGVMYISGEEGVEEPFNNKLQKYNSKFSVAYDVKGSFGIMKAIEKTNPKFVFVDSLNRLGLDVNDIIRFKEAFPNTVFIYVLQATKEGSFKGSQSIEHEVTSTIRVVDGVAHQRGRTVPEPTELSIFN